MHFPQAGPYFSPFLLALLLLEVGAAVVWRKTGIFDFRMTLANLTIKKLRLLALLPAIPVSLLYLWIFRHTGELHKLWESLGAWGWLLAFLLTDFAFYVFHVAAHGWNVIWGTHVVHHQSTDFNLSLSGRDGVLEPLFFGLFLLPLAAIGLPPWLLGSALGVVMLVMGAVHCHVIGRLGPLEWFFNTPSHHRVHHRRDVEWQGTRNFGAVLIVWDRIFGTFLAEGDQVFRFGVAHDAPLFDPWRSQVYFYQHLAAQVRKAPAKSKFGLLFSSPLPEPPAEERRRESTPSLAGILALFLVFDTCLAGYLAFAGQALPSTFRSWSLPGGFFLGFCASALLIGRKLSGRGGVAVPALLGLAGAGGVAFGLADATWHWRAAFLFQLTPVLAATFLVAAALRFGARPSPEGGPKGAQAGRVRIAKAFRQAWLLRSAPVGLRNQVREVPAEQEQQSR